MDDLLQFINTLFCGAALPSGVVTAEPDSGLRTLFQNAGAASISCIDPDERVAAAYPRLVLSGEEGDQMQSGDADAHMFSGTVRLEIVTQQSAVVQDELDLLAKIKARVTDLLLGNPGQELPPIQGRTFVVGTNAYNVAVFNQSRPTGRLPAEDPTIKRWGATYRVSLYRQSY